MRELEKVKTKNNENVYNLWRILGTKLLTLVDFWDPIFKTVFPKDFFLFSTLNSKTSRNMRKMRHKVRNGQNLPHESPNFTSNFFQSDFTYNLSHFPQVWDYITKTIFSKYFFLFSILNSRMSKNMCIWRHKLCNSKTGVGPTFTWSNEPWYSLFYNWKSYL